MSVSAVVMMVVYLVLVWGGLAFGAFLLSRSDDESAGVLPRGWVPGETSEDSHAEHAAN